MGWMNFVSILLGLAGWGLPVWGLKRWMRGRRKDLGLCCWGSGLCCGGALWFQLRYSAHLAEIGESAQAMFDRLMEQMKKAEGVTEQLKASDQMEWVGRMYSIRSRAEEIVFSELVYC